MQNFALIRIFWRSRRPDLSPRPCKSQAGFTLIELLVVVVLISVLAAIAAPSWLGFVQQRRVTAANDTVVRALQQAQSQAKSRKLTYSVSLRFPSGGVPEIAVYQSKQPDPGNPSQQIAVNPNNLTANAWQSFGQLGIKPGQIWLGTNVDSSNNTNVGNYASNNLNSVPNTALTTVTFDYTGSLPTTPTPNLTNQGLIIAVAAAQPNSNPPQPIYSTSRCVKIVTLLGSLQAGKIDSQTKECKPIG